MIKPNKVRFAIATYLLSGYTPWGIDLSRVKAAPPRLVLCDNDCKPRWIMCCGHTLTPEQGREWLAEALVAEGLPDRFGRPTLVAGPHLWSWLSNAWEGLQVRTWGASPC